MSKEEPHRKFECVNMMREIRDRISVKSAGMTHEGLHDWYRAQRCSDPSFERWLRQCRQGRTGVKNARYVAESGGYRALYSFIERTLP